MQQVVKQFNGCDKHRTSVDTKETLEKTEKTIKNGQSRETGNAEHTKCRKTKQKHNTICLKLLTEYYFNKQKYITETGVLKFDLNYLP
jgi:hypothetical protein